MAPVDAERLRRRLATYAILAMVVVSAVVAGLSITPLALRLREDAVESLRHELTLKVMAGGEVVARAVDLAQQVTSRTVIRQKLESYNRGEIGLEDLRDFTSDKLADALSLSPDLKGISRKALDGQSVAVLGTVESSEVLAQPVVSHLSVTLAQGRGETMLAVVAPIMSRDGVLTGTDLVIMSGHSLLAVVDEVSALGRRSQAALIDLSGPARPAIVSDAAFVFDDRTAALATRAVDRNEPSMDVSDGMIAAAARLPGTRWALLLLVPTDEVMASVDTLLLMVLAGAATVIGLGVLGLHKVLRPLTGVFIVHSADMARQIADLQQAQADLARKSHDLALSNAELQEYAYAASHDLQEPVRSIVSFAQLLQRRYGGKMGPEADEFITFIVEGAERMHHQILDLLAYARLGHDDSASDAVDMNVVASQAIHVLHGAIDASGGAVHLEPLPIVRGTHSGLSRLMQNLIANALKFTKPGQPGDIRIDAVIDGQWAEFRVRDNGIGIAPEYHERIFRMFERLHPRGRYEGSGIGLAICRKVVEREGGRIWVTSQEGEGCTFHFLLPLA